MKMQPRSADYLNESQELHQESTAESLVCLTLPKLTNKLLLADPDRSNGSQLTID